MNSTRRRSRSRSTGFRGVRDLNRFAVTGGLHVPYTPLDVRVSRPVLRAYQGYLDSCEPDVQVFESTTVAVWASYHTDCGEYESARDVTGQVER